MGQGAKSAPLIFLFGGAGGDGGGWGCKACFGGGLRVLPFFFEHLFNRL